VDDLVKLVVEGGKGGNGAVHLSLGKVGRPDGGAGGRGGSVSVVARESMRDLAKLGGIRIVAAEDGENGGVGNRSGRKARSETIEVPGGTMVWRVDETGKRELQADLVQEGDSVVVAAGGEGGRGNRKFATPTNTQPLLAEGGEAGERLQLELEMKQLTDMALIGAPNSGKSALLAAVSGARPKVASYPFTTTDPVLGTVDAGRERAVVAEMPGLPPESHLGRGLGNGFLRHAERAWALLLLVDGEQEDLVAEYQTLVGELKAHGGNWEEKQWVTVVTKMDLPEAKARLLDQAKALREVVGGEPIPISVVTGEGIESVLGRIEVLSRERPSPASEVEAPDEEGHGATPEHRDVEPVQVWREDELFVVSCTPAERITAMVDMQNWTARMQLHGELERLGVLRALRKRGVAPGDTVRIGSVEMEWQ
jgi:GTP-binding protein